jgi:hypothetical protein
MWWGNHARGEGVKGTGILVRGKGMRIGGMEAGEAGYWPKMGESQRGNVEEEI